MYPQVTQLETRTIAAHHELQLRDLRRKRRPSLLGRLRGVVRAAAPRTASTGRVGRA
jgi:hypothetical protein